jgi:aconitate hydratase
MLRKANVVGKFVEFFGEGARTLSVTERATIANMAPEYGATVGLFPIDDRALQYLAMTGRSDEKVDVVRRYFEAQNMFGIPLAGQCDYTSTLALDLGTVQPCVAGPKRPQDRIELGELGRKFADLFTRTDATGYGRPAAELDKRVVGPTVAVATGDVLIAAITSCTNTSNPGVMLAAGLLAKKAVERGLTVRLTVKTSLAPGSRVVTKYLEAAGLTRYLDALGFQTVGYGCTTCIGNSGPLSAEIEELVTDNDLVAASVLSGNRNFEARVHQSIKANFLMSPPLVVAFALAGRVTVDLAHEPIGLGKDGEPVFLRDIWPTHAEMDAAMAAANDPKTYREMYAEGSMKNRFWDEVPAPTGTLYAWDAASTYIQEAPFFTPFEGKPARSGDVVGARPLAMFGDSVTTDHISPAGGIKATSPAGKYLLAQGVAKDDFNSYGARRGNHHVMMRGTFANVRIKNLMVPGVEGGVTIHRPSGEQMAIYDAAMRYQADAVPTVILAGAEYGSGSSRDWAAKGPLLLGVRAVVATSFERIHRSNLVFMGVLPCQFRAGDGVSSLGLDGTETFDVVGIAGGVRPRMEVELVVHRASGKTDRVRVIARIDTPIEADYYEHGGILPYVLRKLLG